MRTQDLRKICTAVEYKLFHSAAAQNIAKLDATKLRPAIKKAEALVSKLKAQAKKAVKAKSAAAKAKAKAFEGAAKRLRDRLVKLERAAVSRVTGKRKKKTTRKAKAARAKTSAVKGVSAKPAARKPAARGASRPARKPRSATVPGVTRNPLTHRGTKTSRTQLLFEHQGTPVEPATRPARSGADVAHGSNLGELVRETEVRNRMLKSQSDHSLGKRVENMLSATANTRIGGHASGSGRRAQGRRDAAQRGEKRPDKAGFDS